jgi:hypothetical protein
MNKTNIDKNNNIHNTILNSDIQLSEDKYMQLLKDLDILVEAANKDKIFESVSSDSSTIEEAFPMLKDEYKASSLTFDPALNKETLLKISDVISIESKPDVNKAVTKAIKESGLLEKFAETKKIDIESSSELQKSIESISEKSVALRDVISLNDGKLIIDFNTAWKHTNKLYEYWTENRDKFEIVTGMNPLALASTAFVYNSVVKNFARVVYPNSIKMSPVELVLRRKALVMFSIGAAPAITGFLVSIAHIKPITSVSVEVLSSSSNVDSTLIGMNIFKNLFKNPGIKFFFVLSFVSYIFKNYFPVNSDTINIVSIFQFSLVWILIFTSYSLILLYVANSITPLDNCVVYELKLPSYLPKFIKDQLQLINILVHENKKKAVEIHIRIVFMFILLLIITIIMFSLLIYYK